MSHDTQIIGSAIMEQSDTRLEQLKRHRKIANQIKAKDPENAHLHTTPDKITRHQEASATKKSSNLVYKPKFKWEKKDNDQTFHIIPSEKSKVFNSIHPTTSSTNQLLSLFGYKIDISHQVDQLKHKMQKFFIESKSHNALVGKFSELKFGMMTTLLSILGIEPNTIEKLKRDSLKKAIEDNINRFEQNEYNAELIAIFTKTKKDTARVKIFTELRKQLIKQMKNFGHDNYYSKEKIYTIKKDQIKKILGDLLEEKQSLTYIRSFK